MLSVENCLLDGFDLLRKNRFFGSVVRAFLSKIAHPGLDFTSTKMASRHHK